MNDKNRQYYVFSIIVFVSIFVDQLTKLWARHYLEDRNLFIGSTKIGFSLTTNPGSSFSLFSGSTIWLTVVAIALTVALLVGGLKAKENFMRYAYIVIASGAMGNIIDRFFQPPRSGHGHVTDFIKVGSFPTFNIADSCVSLGAVSIVVYALFFQGRKNGNG